MREFIVNLPAALPAVLITVAFVAALWYTVNWRTPFDDHEELFDKGNTAYLVQRLGLVAAQVIAMLAVIPYFDRTDPLWSSFWLFTEGLWVFVAILLARPVIDFVLLPKTRNMDLLLRGNLAIGITEAAFYVGIGFLLNGSLTGGAPTLWQAIASTVAFYALGLGFVFAAYWLQELVTHYDMRSRLADGDVAAALELGGFLVGASIVTRVGVAGDFTAWLEGLGWFFVTAIVSVAVLYLVRVLSNGLILRSWSLRGISRLDGRSHAVTPAAMSAGIMVLSGIVVSTVIGSVA